MRQKAILVIIVSFCLGGIVSSQVTDLEFRQFQEDFRLAKSFKKENKTEYDGSPYLLDEFRDAEIYLKNGRQYEDVPMNYNIHNDDFEFMMDDISYSLGNNNIVKNIRVGDRDFYYRNYTYNSARIKGYLELVADGDYKIFKKHRVIYTEPKATRGYVEAQPARFSPRRPDYFIELTDGNIVYFNKLKEIADLLPENSDKLKDYIRDNRLKARREEDIITLAGYINGK
ncbi:MAG: hypothetical protein ACLFN1_08290 [Bacteroidales bacterium]